ncbi:DNA ligase D [soil metagenome]
MGRVMSPPTATRRSGIEPMLCAVGSGMPDGDGWTFEPKYDGIRVVAYATKSQVLLLTRNGNDKSQQFPDLVKALRALSGHRGRPLVLDCEVVALEDGEIARFGKLLGRMHVKDEAKIRMHAQKQSAALIAFDLLLDGQKSLLNLPWQQRRTSLEELFVDGEPAGVVRLGESDEDGDRMLERAGVSGWEGLVAKRIDSLYRPGRRSRDWLKLKLENTQEFVVGGWTEPRGSRQHLGALLLGYYAPDGTLEYAGHTGTGFDRNSLLEMSRRLSKLERKTPPFRQRPVTNETAHWVTPKLVVQVRFNEWTRHGTLRQPVYLGIMDDKDPRKVVREAGADGQEPHEDTGSGDALAAQPEEEGTSKRRNKPVGKSGAARKAAPKLDFSAVARRLREIQAEEKGAGEVAVPSEGALPVTNLNKVFFPKVKGTKGDLLCYYAEMSPYILPAMKDRPLILKRFPNGVRGKAFYQQSAPEDVPPGVRAEYLIGDDGERQARLIGGNLATLLYTIQLGAISYDPWHSRIQSLEVADYTVIDLDPGPGATFATVIAVARLVREEMESLGLHGALKTSGSSGMHIYLPLPHGTPLEAATLVAQIVAARVASKHPRIATVERMTRSRARGTIYVDYLQNILGKTVAGVYAIRAKEEATVSTPIGWDELVDDLDLRDFTMRTVPDRVKAMGDIWGSAMAEPNSLDRLRSQ